MPEAIEPETRDFYLRVMALADEAGIPYLLAGAYALQQYTGIERHTKDIDLFLHADDAGRLLRIAAEAGYRSEMTHPHWLGKIYEKGAFVDLIFRSGNAVSEVDREWFEHATPGHVLGKPVRICPVEEMIWTKAFIMERERFDGADVAHLILAQGERLDWRRLVRRFGPDWRVLFSHMLLFGFIYPTERRKVPAWIIDDLTARMKEEDAIPAAEPRVCQGTLLSRSQYLIDVESRGFEDARLKPRGRMTREEIDRWTESISIDGSR